MGGRIGARAWSFRRPVAGILFCVWTLATAGGASPPSRVPIDVEGRPDSVHQAKQSESAGVGRGRAVIRGTVKAGDTGGPLRGVDIRLVGGGLSRPRFVVTDDQGRYEIGALPAGRYTLTASKVGYVRLSYGQRLPLEEGKSLDLADGQVFSTGDFALPRAGVIVAKITDESGDPIPGVLVQALQSRFTGGERKLVVATANSGLTGTDDRGEVRLFDLAPGQYYVAARRGFVSGFVDQRRSDAQVFYPGTVSIAEAQLVAVGTGDEVPITFSLVNTKSARMSGTIVSSGGATVAEASVQLLHIREGGVSSRPVALLPDGSFSARELPPGDYAIQVRVGLGTANEEYASVPVHVSGEDLTDLVIMTSRAAVVRGRIVFDTGDSSPGLRPDTIQITPEFTGLAVARGRVVVRDDWTFRVEGIMGTGVLRVRHSTEKWFLKAVVFNGQDVTDTPLDFKAQLDGRELEVQLTQKRTEVVGVVVNSRSTPITDYVAVAFAEEPERWTPNSRFVALARPNQSGQFTIVGLPPERYFIAAVEYLERGEERNRDTLERLRPTATRLTLGEGESRHLALTLSPSLR